MRRKWTLIAAGVLFSVLALAAVIVLRPKQQAPARVAGAVSLPANAPATLTGFVRAQHIVMFGTTTNGNIEAFFANVGDEVFAEQVVARIGSGDLESARENASRAVERAQERLDRAEEELGKARLEESRAGADAERTRSAFNRADALYTKYKIARTYNAVAEQVFRKSEAEFEAARDEYEASEKSWRAAVAYVRTNEGVVENAKLGLEQSLAALEEARRGMEAAEVRAPIDGVIVARNGQIGQPALETGEQMFQLATDFVAMEVPVQPQPSVLQAAVPGLPALVLIPELTDAGIPGQIKAIEGGTVVVEFISNLPALRPGMKADVRLKVD